MEAVDDRRGSGENGFMAREWREWMPGVCRVNGVDAGLGIGGSGCRASVE